MLFRSIFSSQCTWLYLFSGLDYDEAVEEGDDEDVTHHQISLSSPDAFSTPKITQSQTFTLSPAKPILKSQEKETSLPRKSVRFSLRPGNSSISKTSEASVASETSEIITPDHQDVEQAQDENIAENEVSAPTISAANSQILNNIKSPPKKRKPEDAMDKTVEEFNKVVEAEEKELKSSHNQPSITSESPQISLQPVANQQTTVESSEIESTQQTSLESSDFVESTQQNSLESPENHLKQTRRGRVIHPPDLEAPSEKEVRKVAPKQVRKKEGSSPAVKQDHSAMIAELMRKNPNMFKVSLNSLYYVKVFLFRP